MRKDKLIPELRFQEFKDEGEWEEKTLDEVAEVNPSSSQLPSEFVYVDLESVENGALLKRRIIKREEAPSRAQRLLKDSDVIFQMVRPYQKNNYFFRRSDNLEYVASTGYAQLRAFDSSMYLYQFIHTDNFVSKVLEKCTGSNYPAINSSDLSGIKVEIPQPKEQQKIASCLSSLDEVITAQSQKLVLLKEHKKGLMQNLFPQEGETVPKYRFPEFVEDGEWEKKSVEYLFKFKQGVQVPVENQYLTKNQGMVRFIRIIDITNPIEPHRFIDNPGESHLIGDEDLFMIRYGTPGIISIGHNGVIANNLFRIIWKSESQFVSKFWFYAFQRIENEIYNLSSSSSMPAISFTTLECIILQYSKNPKEQQKIASCLLSLDELITAQTEKIEQLKLHKQGLMQGLFPKNND